MEGNKGSLERCEIKLKIRMNRLIALEEEGKRLFSNPHGSRGKEIFLAESESCEALYGECLTLMDELEVLRGKLDEKYVPSYKEWEKCDSLRARIKTYRARLGGARGENTSGRTEEKQEREDLEDKLPTAEIPTFDGNPETWEVFYSLFRENVHENRRFSTSRKLQILKSKLTGRALLSLSGFMSSSDTYEEMWDFLVRRFNDVRCRASQFLDFVLKRFPNRRVGKDLESYLDKHEAYVSSLLKMELPNLLDFIFCHSVLCNLDKSTVLAFDRTFREVKYPSYKDLVIFLREGLASSARLAWATEKDDRTLKSKSTVNSFFLMGEACGLCKSKDHYCLVECKEFLNIQSPEERFKITRKLKVCICCLKPGHSVSKCPEEVACKLCQKSHHTLLHFRDKKFRINSAPGSEDREEKDKVVANVKEFMQKSTVSERESVTYFQTGKEVGVQMLLPTARVWAAAADNLELKQGIRCLLDSCSQDNLITQESCERLGLTVIPINSGGVRGVNGVVCPIRGVAELVVSSRVDSSRKFQIRALVVDSITTHIPAIPIDITNWNFTNPSQLADPEWDMPGPIDVILGVELFPLLIKGSAYPVPGTSAYAFDTVFGQVIMGKGSKSTRTHFCALSISELLQKFWVLEDLPDVRMESHKDVECEKLFIDNTKFEGGRFSVALPFAEDPKLLGKSFEVAHKRFRSLERRFKLTPGLKEAYQKIIHEYCKENYLRAVPVSHLADEGFFIPHHPVLKADKSKLRMVLDASAKTSSGISLNDILHQGPNLQTELFDLLINFRLFAVAIVADIRQMYLQIKVRKEHRRFLRILFRFEEGQELQTYEFQRLPFGLKSSPFLAMRVLKMLANKYRAEFSRAAWILENARYMDDLVYSLESEETAIKLSKELIDLCKIGGFDLIKWNSNAPTVLEALPQSHRIPSVPLGENPDTKVLGLKWEVSKDIFTFVTSPPQEKCTKRTILSTISRIFDVLGLVAPVVVVGKLVLRDLWLTGKDWDADPPVEIVNRFQKLVKELPHLQKLAIPRYSGVKTGCKVYLIAFCDASMKAYGSVVYLCTSSDDGIQVRLLCAKSRVAPLKVVSLPRLELCAVVLMAKLISRVKKVLQDRVKVEKIYAFSDSTIALSWVTSSPHRWSVFVSNRVALCQELLDIENLYHVPGQENPGDCLSRGLLPTQLLEHKLWWEGPTWLKKPISEWPYERFRPTGIEGLPEYRMTSLTLVETSGSNYVLKFIEEKVSSWERMIRTIYYILKFGKRLVGRSKVEDLKLAEEKLVMLVQKHYFENEILALKQKKRMPKHLLKLDLFLAGGILRVGGRLDNSGIPFSARHPALLPSDSPVTHALVDHVHSSYCHLQTQTLIAVLRQEYWVLRAGVVVKQRVRKCVRCFRTSPNNDIPKMANLPSCRVNPSEKAFAHTGVDYAGPIRFTPVRRRGQHAAKAYIVVFVCMAVKAVHLELATDLSAEAFIRAFLRFIARRGPVVCLYSDNATNFVGAKARLTELHLRLSRTLESRGVTWHFNPPGAPHFGGLWEATVRVIKTHLFRVMGSQLLSYEELLTLLAQIESLMNSRPLVSLKSDPAPEALTPAHFLSTSPLLSLPYSEWSEGRTLSERKALLDSMLCSFWRRWSREYLHTLQVRPKWWTDKENLGVGTVVVLAKENVPPFCWPLGVVEKVFPGSDGAVRVVEVRTSEGNFRRPVSKVFPLPL